MVGAYPSSALKSMVKFNGEVNRFFTGSIRILTYVASLFERLHRMLARQPESGRALQLARVRWGVNEPSM
jgi:hypothetical protein